MNEPRRLIHSGGISQRLLDSASIDRPGPAARRHAAALSATANAFARTSSSGSGTYRAAGRSAGSGHRVKTVVTWLAVGAAASVALGLVGSRLLGPSSASHGDEPLASLPTLSPTPVVSPPEIAPEPPVAPPQLIPAPVAAAAASGEAAPTHIEPWVASLTAAPVPGATRAAAAPANEVVEIEAARAALSRGDTDATFIQLNAYDSSHPQGQLKPESMALRIQALRVSAKTSEARALATAFLEQYPGHPLAQRVRAGFSK